MPPLRLDGLIAQPHVECTKSVDYRYLKKHTNAAPTTVASEPGLAEFTGEPKERTEHRISFRANLRPQLKISAVLCS